MCISYIESATALSDIMDDLNRHHLQYGHTMIEMKTTSNMKPFQGCYVEYSVYERIIIISKFLAKLISETWISLELGWTLVTLPSSMNCYCST